MNHPADRGAPCPPDGGRSIHLALVPVMGLVVFLASCAEPIIPDARGPEWVAFAGPAQPFRNNRVNAIIATRAGQVWIGTDSGVVFFDRGSWGAIIDSVSYPVLQFGTVTSQATITAIAQGKDGSIWFGTNGGGIRRFFPTGQEVDVRWMGYREPAISGNVITGLTCDLVFTGEVWAGTHLFGANRFIPSAADPRFGEWRRYTTAEVPEFGSNQVSAATVSIVNGRIWVSSIFTLAAFLGENSGWRAYPSGGGYDYRILSMSADLSDDLWVGKREGAAVLDRYRNWTEMTASTTGGQLPPGPVHAVTTDLLATRWFGTDHGLVRLRDTTWTTFDRRSTPVLPSDTITAVAYDQYKNLWIGTVNGVCVHNEKGVFF